MPRYFFHIHDGKDLMDTEGTVYPDDAAAKREAGRACASMIAEMGDEFWTGTKWRMDVMEESGRHVASLHLYGELEEH